MTPKERVLKKWPGAWLWLQPESRYYYILPKGAYIVHQEVGAGETPRQAWADAAKRLRQPSTGGA